MYNSEKQIGELTSTLEAITEREYVCDYEEGVAPNGEHADQRREVIGLQR